MNCFTCEHYFDAYFEGVLSSEMKSQMEEHLDSCKSCAEMYALWQKAEYMIKEEKSTSFNPFLATRVMSKLEMPSETAARKQLVFKPVTIAFIVGIAVFLGVILGNLYQPVKLHPAISEEMFYLNDGAIEPIAFYEAK